MKTQEEILKAQTAKEVFEWMKAQKGDTVAAEVAAYFNALARAEYRALNPDPNVIFDPNLRSALEEKK